MKENLEDKMNEMTLRRAVREKIFSTGDQNIYGTVSRL